MVEDNLKLLVVAGSSLGIYIVLRTLIFPLLKRIAKKTNTIIDDLFLEKKFLNRVSFVAVFTFLNGILFTCLLYTSPSPRDVEESRMPSSA